MLIEICEDVVDAALNRVSQFHDDALRILQDCCVAIQYGAHLIYFENKCLKKLANSNVEGINCSFFKQLKQSKPTEYSMVKNISFRAKVTFKKKTNRLNNEIIINPIENGEFRISDCTHFLCEDISDCEFYNYVCRWYQKTHNFRNIDISFYKLQGGGVNICRVCEQDISNKSNLCLAIVDNDKSYPNCNEIGETAQNLQQSCVDNPFNVHYYILEYVSEIENLVPWHLISSVCPNARRLNAYIIENINLSFFDFKKGIPCYKIKKDDDYFNYWYDQFNSNDDIQNDLKAVKECVITPCTKKCNTKREVVKGVGGNIMDEILNKKSKDLMNVKEENLTDSQRLEWNKIGKLVFEWCCSGKHVRS